MQVNTIRSSGAALGIALAMLLSGCVATMPQAKRPSTPAEHSAAIKTERDDFKKVTRYVGSDEAAGTLDTVFIRATKFDDPKINPVYQIYVADYYTGEWRFYNSAYDSNGKRLDFVSIDRKVGSCGAYTGCSKTEHFTLVVSRDYLEANSSSGVTFKVSGRAGEKIHKISPEAIVGFLQAVPK